MTPRTRQRAAAAALLVVTATLAACSSSIAGNPVAATTPPAADAPTTGNGPTGVTPSDTVSPTESSSPAGPTSPSSTAPSTPTGSSSSHSTSPSPSSGSPTGSQSPAPADEPSVTRPKVPASGPVTVAVNGLPQALDIDSSDANSYRTEVAALTLPSPYVMDPRGDIARDGDLITQVTVHRHPQTVIYQISPQATWSDGTPVSCQDFYLAWLVQSSKALDPKDKNSRAFHSYWTGRYDNAKAPRCSDGGRTVMVEFTDADAGWQRLFQGMLPAHIAAQDAGISDITSIDAGDTSGAVLALAKAYNKDFGKLTPDTAVSAGPYVVTKVAKDSVTLERNPSWWGNPAGPSAITLVPEPNSQAQLESIKTGETDVASLTGRDLLQVYDLASVGVTRSNQVWPIKEHVEFNLHNKLFTGKAGKALQRAVFSCIGPSAIVNTVAKQLNPDATVLGNMFVEPWASGYQDHYASYRTADVAKAKKLMQQGGWTMKDGVFQHGSTTATLVLGYRASLAALEVGQLIEKQCKKAGIVITLNPLDDTALYSGTFQAALFGRATPNVPADFAYTYSSKSSGNVNRYANPTVDRLLKEIAADINLTDETDRLNTIDKLVAADHTTLPLYAWSVINLQSAGIHTTVTNNYYWGGVVWDAYAWTGTD